MPNWIPLCSVEDVEKIRERSQTTPCLIFKHSTRCNISSIAQYRLDADWSFSDEMVQPYFIDLLKYRSVSNTIADVFQVHHESPQVLLIVQGECVYDASHLDVRVEEIEEALSHI